MSDMPQGHPCRKRPRLPRRPAPAYQQGCAGAGRGRDDELGRGGDGTGDTADHDKT